MRGMITRLFLCLVTIKLTLSVVSVSIENESEVFLKQGLDSLGRYHGDVAAKSNVTIFIQSTSSRSTVQSVSWLVRINELYLCSNL